VSSAGPRYADHAHDVNGDGSGSAVNVRRTLVSSTMTEEEPIFPTEGRRADEPTILKRVRDPPRHNSHKAREISDPGGAVADFSSEH